MLQVRNLSFVIIVMLNYNSCSAQISVITHICPGQYNYPYMTYRSFALSNPLDRMNIP